MIQKRLQKKWHTNIKQIPIAMPGGSWWNNLVYTLFKQNLVTQWLIFWAWFLRVRIIQAIEDPQIQVANLWYTEDMSLYSGV